GVPVPLLDLLESCFDDDAEERPADATAFLDRLPSAQPARPEAPNAGQEPGQLGKPDSREVEEVESSSGGGSAGGTADRVVAQDEADQRSAPDEVGALPAGEGRADESD